MVLQNLGIIRNQSIAKIRFFSYFLFYFLPLQTEGFDIKTDEIGVNPGYKQYDSSRH